VQAALVDMEGKVGSQDRFVNEAKEEGTLDNIANLIVGKNQQVQSSLSRTAAPWLRAQDPLPLDARLEGRVRSSQFRISIGLRVEG